MVGSTALFIVMPIVVVICLGMFIVLPFVGDRVSNRHSGRSPSAASPGDGAIPQQRRGGDDTVAGEGARAERDASLPGRANR